MKRLPPAEGAEAAGFWAASAEGPQDRDPTATLRCSLFGLCPVSHHEQGSL